jgi:hypothetical protein
MLKVCRQAQPHQGPSLVIRTDRPFVLGPECREWQGIPSLPVEKRIVVTSPVTTKSRARDSSPLSLLLVFRIDRSTTEAPRIVMRNGFTYRLQELVFFSWFFSSRSVGVNGWFSDNGTFLTNAGPPCQ